MANSLSASFPAYWSKRMQVTFLKKAVYRSIVSFEEQETLKKGTVVHRPYRSAMTVNTLSSDGAYTRQDITDTDETLTINQEKEVSFYIRSLDEIQSNYKTRNEYADEAATRLALFIDGDVLGEYDTASSIIDDNTLSGGTSGNGVQMTTSNIQSIFSVAGRMLDRKEVDGERWAVVSPEMYQVLLDYLGGRETALGDTTGTNGHVGKFGGFQLYKSSATGFSAVLSMVTQPTDTDTVTMKPAGGTTITFTFKTTLGATPGNVLIGGSADAARANLAALINTPGTTTANGVALSAANQAQLKGVTATNDNTADTLTIKAEGWGFYQVAETFTDATDTWTAAKQITHCLFGQGHATDLVIQVKPEMMVKPRDGYIGSDIVSWTVYGLKTFVEGTKRLVDVKVRTDALVA